MSPVGLWYLLGMVAVVEVEGGVLWGRGRVVVLFVRYPGGCVAIGIVVNWGV